MSKTPYDPNNPDVDALLQEQRKIWQWRQLKKRFRYFPLLASLIIATFMAGITLFTLSLSQPDNYWLHVAISVLTVINALLTYHRFFRPDPQSPTVQDELETWRG